MRQADDAFTIRYEEPEEKNRTCLIVGLIVGGAVVVALLCGGCCAGFGYWGFNRITTEVRDDLADNEVILEHVGAIESFEMLYPESFARSESEVFVFRVSGDKGSGKITAKSVTGDDGLEYVESGTLVLDNGETYELIPDTPMN